MTAGPFKAVSFDVHGTLLVPHPSVGAIYAAVAHGLGIATSPAELEQRFPSAFRTVQGRWPVPYGRDEAEARAFWDEVIDATFAGRSTPDLRRRLFERFGSGSCWRVLPGARETLAALAAAGLPRYVCSNFDLRVRRILADHGLLDFVRVVLSAEVGAAKPDPAMLQAIAADADCPITAVLHVGDSAKEDGAACQAAGCTWLPVDPARGPDPELILATAIGRASP